jgi:hypothetical protein
MSTCAFCKSRQSELRRLTLFQGIYVCEVCADAIAMAFGRPVPRVVSSSDSQTTVDAGVHGSQEESEP